MRKIILLVGLCLLGILSVSIAFVNPPTAAPVEKKHPSKAVTDSAIHVMVALCDNQYQGIVPVPKGIGNGQQPKTNLYWGCGYGIKTYFKKSAQWELVSEQKIDSTLLERLIFRHKTKGIYLIADAYNGKEIKTCIQDFLSSASGKKKENITLAGKVLGSYGDAKLIAYIGHDGLMDFELSDNYTSIDKRTRPIISLACYSKRYFGAYLSNAHILPLVWTTGLMCPEAYTLHDALEAFIKGDSKENIRLAAAQAYAKYQKISLKAALGLLVQGK